MKFGNQTDTITCLDEQKRMPGLDSASTDFDVLEIVIELASQKIDDKADTKVFDLESQETARGFTDWTEIMDPLMGQTITPPLGLSNTKLWAWETVSELPQIQGYRFGYLPQAQSDLIPSEEEKQQANITTTTHIEKNLQVEVAERVEGIFRAIAEEVLEGKIEGAFAKSLSECIGQYQGIAVNEIHHLILKEKVSSESAEATLRILGDIDHQPTYHYRRWLLEKALICSSSPIVRDGANVGLSYMDDPHAIPFLKDAIKNEKLLLLRKVIEQTLVQLENE